MNSIPLLLRRLLFVGFFAAISNSHAANPSDITDLILVTGQSNVTGSQTQYDPALDGVDSRIFAFTSNNDWEVADLHQAWDVDGWHPGNGSIQDPSRSPYNSFAFQFAKTLVQSDPDRVVGLIIAGAPGQGIQHWNANGAFWQTIESKVLAAINAHGSKSEIDGILWHQGETDWQFNGTSDPDASFFERSYDNYYPEKLADLITRFRDKNWYSDSKPFICGETRQSPVNARLMALNSNGDPLTRCVAASDLPTLEMDLGAQPPQLGIHFNATGLRTLGQRYAMMYSELTESSPKIDSTIPTATVTSPTSGSSVATGVVDIAGIASDIGSGVNRVRVQVRAVGISPLLSWDGNSWVTTHRFLDANLNSDGSWTLPDVDLSAPGNYRVFLVAYDNSGNLATWRDNPLHSFSVLSSDRIKPTATVTTPANASVISPGFIDISGTSSDNESGVSRVRVQVREIGVSPLKSWNGNAWVTKLAFIDANLHSDGSWTLPDVDLNGIGTYRVFLTVFDKNGNVANWKDNPAHAFTIRSSDNTIPAALTSTPAHGSSLSPGTLDVSGVASDAESGVIRVRVQIRAVGVSPLLSWNGDGWVTALKFVEANLNSDGSWTVPDIAFDTAGSYRVFLMAYDKNGNTATWRDNPITSFSIQ